jgi:hypothetical protein
MTEPRRFYLDRNTDVTGASGTGRVADGVLWPDGTVTIRWRGEHQSTVNWDNLDSAERVHGHDGATRIVYLDPAGGGSGKTVFRLLPDDVLLIGNAGQCEEDNLLASVEQLRKDLPTATNVFVFAENIDVETIKDAELLALRHGTHRYLSTGCLHGGDGHRYCAAPTSSRDNPKRPAECKFCSAPCICSCHNAAQKSPETTPC